MTIEENLDLKAYNTLRVSALAKYFSVIHTPNELKELANQGWLSNHSIMFLGEGANVLFTKDFSGLVVKNEIKGKKIVAEDEYGVTLEIQSGENWHELVMFAVEHDWSGIENLAYIPGTVGAAPVQNIAAYGQNFEDVFLHVNGYLLDSPKKVRLQKTDCRFGYRESLFKHDWQNKFFISSVAIKLSKTPKFAIDYHSRYESLQAELDKITRPPYTPKIVAQAVTALRKVKQPDWHQVGTAGSFFKNPVVTKEKLKELQSRVSELQYYPVDKLSYPQPDDPQFDYANHVKIPAARLLDELGWRGKRIGQVGTFERQAMVIVNYGSATGKEILDFSQKMQADVRKNYDIDLEPEVNII